MVQLMVIADDFTGALDTGVHFASKGIRTRVIVSLGDDRSWDEGLRSDQATVLVVLTSCLCLTILVLADRLFGGKAGGR